MMDYISDDDYLMIILLFINELKVLISLGKKRNTFYNSNLK